MGIRKSWLADLLLLLIITIPAFVSLLSSQYFTMHDDQHIVRLFLLDQGIRQGYLFPRWVDGLGFGFGYPLYNFYPPFIYYLGEVFHLARFSFIWSIKLVFISGFYFGALGVYALMKKLTGRISAFVAAALYTYFFYHAVLIYVRGALAEFVGLSVLPYLFLTLLNLTDTSQKTNTLWFAIVWALLILTHPLVAFPSAIFIILFVLFLFFTVKEKRGFLTRATAGIVGGLGLSAFFWLPSLLEKKYTLIDSILTRELAHYRLHFIEPFQFIFSLWGYGGSASGTSDGMTFQLGKVHIGLFLSAILLSVMYYAVKKKEAARYFPIFYFFVFLLLFSLLMTTEYSLFLWQRIGFLAFLQFPWRFLTFAAIFMAVIAGYAFFFAGKFIPRKIVAVGGLLIIMGTIFVYSKYFRPQHWYETTDVKKTSKEEVEWTISRTSYEFVPRGVKTKKTEIGTTILDIGKEDIPSKAAGVIAGNATIVEKEQKFSVKKFEVSSIGPSVIRINTFYFPGWKAYVDNREAPISDRNDLKLMEVAVGEGDHRLDLVFRDTPVRTVANAISILGIFYVFVFITYSSSRYNQSKRK